jgi:integrase
MARKPSDKPWLQGATGWWCASISGKRVYLDKDYKVACRELKSLRRKAQHAQPTNRDWLDATFSELADEFLDDVKARKPASTYRSVRHKILRALRILGTTLRVGEMRKFHLSKLDQTLVKEEYSPTTTRDTIAIVQQVFNWAVEQELLDVSPVPKYKKPAARSRSRVITPEEFGAIFRKADRHFRRFLIALRLTGCRPGELRTLIWAWVDMERGLWIIPQHKTVDRMKQPRPRIIPLPRTLRMMCRWLARRSHDANDHVFLNQLGIPYTMDCVVRKMARLRERAGIKAKGGEQIVLYSNRHTFGTESSGKISDIELAELMGHTDVRTTQRYTHFNADRLLDIQRRAQGKPA